MGSLLYHCFSDIVTHENHRKENLMSDQQPLSLNSMSQQFSEGTSVYDVNGEQVGTVSKHDLTGNTLLLHNDTYLNRDIQVPLSSVQRSNANGIYLGVSKDELQHERYTAPTATAESSTDGLISRGVDVIEQIPHTITEGVSVIVQAPETVTEGVSVVEQIPDSFRKGETTIDPNAEGSTSGEVSPGGR